MFVDGVCFLGGLMGKKMEHDKIDSSLLSGSDRFKLARTHTHTHTVMHVWMLAHGFLLVLLLYFLDGRSDSLSLFSDNIQLAELTHHHTVTPSPATTALVTSSDASPAPRGAASQPWRS